MFFLQNAAPDVVKVLVGNKCEAPATQRVVDKERGQKVFTIDYCDPICILATKSFQYSYRLRKTSKCPFSRCPVNRIST